MKIAYDYKIFGIKNTVVFQDISQIFLMSLINKSLNYKVFAPFSQKFVFIKIRNCKNINGTYIKDNIPFTSNLIKFYNENFVHLI